MSATPQRERQIWNNILLVVAIALAAGCSKAPSSDLVPVTGRVLLDGRPLESGSISLRAESRETWHQPTGSIGADGSYTIYTTGRPGAPPGHYRVVIFATEAPRTAAGAAHPGLPKSIIPKRYNDPQSTPLRVEVSATATEGAYDLKLAAAAARSGSAGP